MAGVGVDVEVTARLGSGDSRCSWNARGSVREIRTCHTSTMRVGNGQARLCAHANTRHRYEEKGPPTREEPQSRKSRRHRSRATPKVKVLGTMLRVRKTAHQRRAQDWSERTLRLVEWARQAGLITLDVLQALLLQTIQIVATASSSGQEALV